MKLTNALISTLFVLFNTTVFADDIKTVPIGNVTVSSEYQITRSGVAVMTLAARLPEVNDSLRGLKNSDQRRLSKLGQLVYQCKLMLYKSDADTGAFDTDDPNLISRNYSLFTGVDLSLATDERIGIRVDALQAIDDNKLFTATLGKRDTLKQQWETIGEDTAINLRQFDLNILNDANLIQTSESIEVTARFPVFQLEKPVSQWRYNFNLKDFKRAITHIEENCTAKRFIALLEQ